VVLALACAELAVAATLPLSRMHAHQQKKKIQGQLIERYLFMPKNRRIVAGDNRRRLSF
jgi:hypothetical protein